MSAIVFEHIPVNDISPFSFRVEKGSLTAIIAPKQDVCDLLVRLLLGIEKPESGNVVVLNTDLYDLSEIELIELRKRICIVYPSGGLISNLKVWENVSLPLEYHQSAPPQEIKVRCEEALSAVRYSGDLLELPGLLSLYERRLVGQARAFAIRPEIIVYNALLGGLSEEEKTTVIVNALTHHQESSGTTSIFLTAQPETVRALPLDKRIVMLEAIE